MFLDDRLWYRERYFMKSQILTNQKQESTVSVCLLLIGRNLVSCSTLNPTQLMTINNADGCFSSAANFLA